MATLLWIQSWLGSGELVATCSGAVACARRGRLATAIGVCMMKA